ncbi:uncharacterized protein LOC110462769 [Mizuhopecten yessoensis]|nr:uncharacterized protein LOC110462769 [Mizuhopecten yessoensis]
MDDHGRGRWVKVKATWKEVHRRSIDPSLRLEDVKRDVQTWFPLLADQEVSLDLVYQDDDGDEVTIATEEDWREICSNLSELKLSIRATHIRRPKASFSESTKSGYSTASVLRNLSNSDNNQLTNGTQVKTRDSGNMESEVPHQISGIVTQASDDIFQRNGNQEDVSSSGMSPRPEHAQSNFSFSNGQVQSSDEDEVYWPPTSGDTLDQVKVKRCPNPDNVDSRARDPANSYHSDTKGRVIIFNNKKFTSEPDIQGDFDTTCLSLLFKDLKYDVCSYTNQSAQQMREKLEKEKAVLAKTKYSCYIVFILTHCDPKTKTLSGSKGDTIPLDEITGRLKEEDALKGVPKLVFIDGVKHDFQESVPKLGNVPSSNALKMPVTTGVDRPWTAQGVDSTDSCPSNNMDDFYIYMAGTLGEGNPTYKGSLMLQALVKVFCTYMYRDSLSEMMVKVERLMEDARTKTIRFRMPQQTTDTLKKDLYFHVNE